MLAIDVSVHALFETVHFASSPCVPHSSSSVASVLFNPPPIQGVGDGVADVVVCFVVVVVEAVDTSLDEKWFSVVVGVIVISSEYV